MTLPNQPSSPNSGILPPSSLSSAFSIKKSERVMSFVSSPSSKASAGQVALSGVLAFALLVPLVVLPFVAPATSQAAPAVAKPPAPPVSVSVPGSKDGTLVRTVKAFGDADGIELKTVRTNRSYFFTKPKHWKVKGNSAVNVIFQHSNSLLPERSSLNVLVNNRILKSIPLGKNNASKTAVSVPIPPEILKDKNTLTFQVDQHYTYDCEDPFSAELWTTLLPETALVLNYDKAAIVPELAAFPYPLVDELSYGATPLGFVAPATLSPQSQTALAIAASTVGSSLGWRTADANLLDAGSMSSTDANLVLVGTASENPAINSIKLPATEAVGADDGLIAVVPHPGKPHRNVLVLTGGSPVGVVKAAQFLAANPGHKLLSGQAAVIKNFTTTSVDSPRQWFGFVTESGAQLSDLGLETQTARGVTSLPLMYRIKRIPDLAFPGKAKIKLITNYSYASQLDNSQSKLEVRLNGKAIASFPLDKPEGETNASRAIEFPVEDFFSYNELEYQFFTYPPKKNACEFVTDAQIWGTVHNTSRFEFNNEKRSSLPDAGLLNDGGFPFSEVADFSETAIVMPASPSTAEQNTLLQLMLRLGKEAAISGKKLPVVVTPEGLTAEIKSNKHLIVIGQGAVNALKGEIKSKVQLLLEGKTADFSEQEKTLATLSHDSNQGVVEEVLSPWNEKRVVLLAYGETPTAQQNVADLFKKDGSFQAIQEGNITVVNNAGEVRSLTALKRGDARLVYSQQKEGMNLPSWVVFTLGFLGLVGLFTILGSLFAGRKK